MFWRCLRLFFAIAEPQVVRAVENEGRGFGGEVSELRHFKEY
jgi:hypothetical protein